MTISNSPFDSLTATGLPDCQVLLRTTDWAALGTARLTGGEFLPTVLVRLLDPDPVVQASALDDLEPVRHQNSLYEATVPVAMYVAALLSHPAADTIRPEVGRRAAYPMRAALLDWIGSLAYDADDECVAMGERHGWSLGEDPYMRDFRDLRPLFYDAVARFLDYANAVVRDAALLAAIPLAEHSELTRHRGELASHARRLLTTSTNRHDRSRALRALKTWGYDTTSLELPEDIATRRPGFSSGGCADEPPF
ncbi:hypothetical protein ACGFX4_16190 [Kitasatospora sp. NPDC048365]|uniref:hypothetical protein n=1 Tax=Kitasatospora sp. NPDC048365 TaxID=3364050 RepID=UPI00372412F0